MIIYRPLAALLSVRKSGNEQQELYERSDRDINMWKGFELREAMWSILVLRSKVEWDDVFWKFTHTIRRYGR